jgi:hypothetical protein
VSVMSESYLLPPDYSTHAVLNFLSFFCESTFGKLCEDRLRVTLTPYLVKSKAVDDDAFFSAIAKYWKAEKSQLVQKAVAKQSTESTDAKDSLFASGMRGSFAFEHHVADSVSELVSLKNDEDVYVIDSIVEFYLPLVPNLNNYYIVTGVGECVARCYSSGERSTYSS